MLNNQAMRLFLNLWMVLSAALHRCRCGGASWKSTCCSCMKYFRMSENSLWSRCIRGWRPDQKIRACAVL